MVPESPTGLQTKAGAFHDLEAAPPASLQKVRHQAQEYAPERQQSAGLRLRHARWIASRIAGAQTVRHEERLRVRSPVQGIGPLQGHRGHGSAYAESVAGQTDLDRLRSEEHTSEL